VCGIARGQEAHLREFEQLPELKRRAQMAIVDGIESATEEAYGF
jgi:hypothetical protein